MTKASPDADFEQWVKRARQASVAGLLQKRGLWAPRMAGDRGVACPACGGTDRFAVNMHKNLFTCRKSGAGGGALALWAHLEGRDGSALRGRDFLLAAEEVTGEPPPKPVAETDEERNIRAERRAQAAAKAAADNAKAEAERAQKARAYADVMRRFARRIWQRAVPAAGTMVEDYFALRGLPLPDSSAIRFLPDMELTERHPKKNEQMVLWQGPAMVCAMTGPDLVQAANGLAVRRFAGVHVTWLDLAKPKGKIDRPHPLRDGERLETKKTYASWRGAIIALQPGETGMAPDGALRWVAGEGIETVMSVYAFMRANAPEALADMVFVSFVNLENFAGKAAGTMRHPNETRVDSRGRTRPLMVRNAIPKWPDDTRPVPLPDGLRELIWLADGDSEPVFTRNAVERGARRYGLHFPHVEVTAAWPKPGTDFNDMWRMREDAA